MIVVDPDKRYTAEECLSSPFFKLHENSKAETLSKSTIENMKKFKVIA